MKTWWAGAAVVLCLGVCAAGCRSSQPRATAETFEAVFQIHPDGVVDVHEQIAIRPASSATSFERRVAFDRADGVTFVSASIDGRTVEAGRAADAPIVFSDGRSLLVRWEFPAAVNATRALALHYRARNAIEIHGGRGHVRLRVLDRSRTFDVTAARLVLLPPAGVPLFADSGVSEAGWTVTREGSGVAGQRTGLGADDVATIAGGLPVDRSALTDPVWQLNAERADQFAPAFIAGGLFIIVVGVGVLWIVRFEHPRRRTDDEEERRVVRRGLRLGGVACVALSGVAVVVTWLALSQFGVAAMAVPAAIFFVGLLFVAIGGVIV